MSSGKLAGTQFRNEFIKSLNILAPRIAAAIERYGSDPLIVDSLKINNQLTANSATFSAGVQFDSTLTLKDIGTHADTPASGFGVIYVNGDVPYFKTDGGTATSMIGGGGGSPGGSDTQVQYNNGGSFGGVASLTFDDSSGHLTIIDDKKLQFGTNNDASFEYDEDGTNTLLYAGAHLRISDDVKLEFGTGGDAFFFYDEASTDKLLYGGATLQIDDDTKLEFGQGGDASFEYDENGTDRLLYTGAGLRITDDVKLEFGTGGDATIEYDEDGDDVLLINGAQTKFTVAGVEIENGSSTNRSALTIDNNDTDRFALDIDAANINQDVINVAADAVTTAFVMDVTADALTTGGILNLVSNSSDNSARSLVFVHNDHASATGTACVRIVQDAPSTTALRIESDNTETNFGPIVVLDRQNDTVSDGMGVGLINFEGQDDAGAGVGYARISAEASDVSDGAGKGKLILRVQQNVTTTEPNAVEEIMSLDGGNASTGPSVVINDQGYDVDFRVESSGETHMLFVDGGNNRVSIGDSTNIPLATLEVANASDAGVSLVLLDSNDTDQRALQISAANIDADVIDISADALTTANVMDVTADGLTTGAILNLVSDSSDNTARSLVNIINDHASATNVTCLTVRNDSSMADNVPTVLIHDAGDMANDGHATLELRYEGSSAGRQASLEFNQATGNSTDDDDLGQILVTALDSADNKDDYCMINFMSSDRTSGDEGGLIEFKVAAGGTLGTAALKTLFTIGGEDVANTVAPAVVVNEAGINCDFRVESDGNANMLTVSGAKNSVAVGADATLHMDGFSVVDDFQATTFENTFADGEYGSSQILRYSPGAAETLASGQLFFLHTDGTWNQTDADAVATGATQMLGIGLGGSSRTVGCLIRGYIRIPSTEILNAPNAGAASGLPLFVSTTAGHLDFTAPSGNGDFVRVVGYAIDDDSSDILIYFDPDKTHVEITA